MCLVCCCVLFGCFTVFGLLGCVSMLFCCCLLVSFLFCFSCALVVLAVVLLFVVCFVFAFFVLCSLRAQNVHETKRTMK